MAFVTPKSTNKTPKIQAGKKSKEKKPKEEKPPKKSRSDTSANKKTERTRNIGNAAQRKVQDAVVASSRPPELQSRPLPPFRWSAPLTSGTEQLIGELANPRMGNVAVTISLRSVQRGTGTSYSGEVIAVIFDITFQAAPGARVISAKVDLPFSAISRGKLVPRILSIYPVEERTQHTVEDTTSQTTHVRKLPVPIKASVTTSTQTRSIIDRFSTTNGSGIGTSEATFTVTENPQTKGGIPDTLSVAVALEYPEELKASLSLSIQVSQKKGKKAQKSITLSPEKVPHLYFRSNSSSTVHSESSPDPQASSSYTTKHHNRSSCCIVM